MEFRGTMTKVTVNEEDYAHQIFGKDLKIFRKTRGQNWSATMILQIFNAIRNMPGSFGRLHGVELTALYTSPRCQDSKWLILRAGGAGFSTAAGGGWSEANIDQGFLRLS